MCRIPLFWLLLPCEVHYYIVAYIESNKFNVLQVSFNLRVLADTTTSKPIESARFDELSGFRLLSQKKAAAYLYFFLSVLMSVHKILLGFGILQLE